VNFCPQIPYILTDFGEIRARAYRSVAVEFRENCGVNAMLYLRTSLPTNLSARLSVCVSTYLPTDLPAYLCICLSI